MSKYIGTPVVSLVTDTVDVTGDITTTDATPEVIIVNDTSEDTDGGREGKVTFKGQQSGGEETTLAQIQASHDGTADDEKGDLIFKTNDGSDGASPTEAMRIDSSQNVGISTTAPDGKLHVYNGMLQVGSKDGDTSVQQNTNAIRIAAVPNSSTEWGGLQWYREFSNYIGAEIIAARASATESDTDLIFKTSSTSANATERMRIDHNGAVGIGVTPTTIGSVDASLQLSDAFLVHYSDNTTSLSNNVYFDGSNNKALTTGTSSQYYQNGGEHVWRNAASVSAGATASLTESMRINTDGFLRQKTAVVATQSASQTTTFYNSGNGAALYAANAYSSCGDHMEIGCDATAGWASIYLHREWNTGEDARMMQFNVNQGTYGSITTTTSGTTYATSSDYRMKENVTNLTDGITRVKQLQPKRFNFIADETNTLVDGFMAHEAQTVVAEAVRGTHNEVDDDGNPVMQQIDQAKLVPLLTAALQEAIAKIETLETKVAALEGE